jgi:hypothetical protein
MSLATIIPVSRRIDWSYVGVSGGIPTNYTQSGSTIASTGDTTDRLAVIQAAIDTAAATGSKFVLLGAGSFTISATIILKNGVVLRGMGPELTTIRGNCSLIQIREYQARDEPVALFAGTSAAKGDTSIRLASSPTLLGVGMVMQIQEDNDARIVTGIEGDSGPWAMGQWVKVTGISESPASHTYTFEPPLSAAYVTGNNPRVRFNFLNAGGTSRNFIRHAGIEDLKLVNTNEGFVWNVDFSFAEECWMKNVKSEGGSTAHVWLFDSYRCEIRTCHFNGVIGDITSSRGYAVQLGTPNSGLPPDKTTGLLFIDNIVEKTRGGIILGYGASGCVVAYNFFVHMVSDAIYPDESLHQKPCISLHSNFPMMNLIEGNICDGLGVAADMFHGNGYWNTVHRNWLKGHEVGKANGLLSIELDYQHRYYNAIGNVLGYPNILADIVALGGTSRKRVLAGVDAHSYNNDYAGFMLGYYGIGGGTTIIDAQVAATLAAHGNYDYVTPAGQSWETTNTNVVDYTIRVIPDSGFLSSKPAFFGDLAWPPIDPSNPGILTDWVIPAGYRYTYGSIPPGGGQHLPPIIVPPTGTYAVPQQVTITIS